MISLLLKIGRYQKIIECEQEIESLDELKRVIKKEFPQINIDEYNIMDDKLGIIDTSKRLTEYLGKRFPAEIVLEKPDNINKVGDFNYLRETGLSKISLICFPNKGFYRINKACPYVSQLQG